MGTKVNRAPSGPSLNLMGSLASFPLTLPLQKKLMQVLLNFMKPELRVVLV